MEFIRSCISRVVGNDLSLAGMFAVLVIAETLLPRGGQRVSLVSRLRAATFWVVWMPFTVVTLFAFQAVWVRLGVEPLIPSLAPTGWPRPLAIIVAGFGSAFIGDFFYYWCHRAQHRFFWRFHAVHHSIRDLSAVSGYHHVSDEAFKLILYSGPLTLLINDPFSFPILGALLGFQGFYLHSVTKLHFGPLGWLIQDNRFHRIHHSVEAQHFDKNFGVFTTLWDHLFGTAYVPGPDEWPETGVGEIDEPMTVLDYLLQPFRPRIRDAGEVATPT